MDFTNIYTCTVVSICVANLLTFNGPRLVVLIQP